MRHAVVRKTDLDTLLTLYMCEADPWRDTIEVREATTEELTNPKILCIGLGGLDGQPAADFNHFNFDAGNGLSISRHIWLHARESAEEELNGQPMAGYRAFWLFKIGRLVEYIEFIARNGGDNREISTLSDLLDAMHRVAKLHSVEDGIEENETILCLKYGIDSIILPMLRDRYIDPFDQIQADKKCYSAWHMWLTNPEEAAPPP